MNKAEDIEQLIYRELPPDRYCYIHNFIVEKDKEIERLNSITNELERYINEEYIYDELGMKIFDASKLQEKLQELKGSNDPSFEEMVGFVENVCKDIKSQSTLHEELEEERKTIAKIVGDFKEVISNE